MPSRLVDAVRVHGGLLQLRVAGLQGDGNALVGMSEELLRREFGRVLRQQLEQSLRCHRDWSMLCVCTEDCCSCALLACRVTEMRL